MNEEHGIRDKPASEDDSDQAREREEREDERREDYAEQQQYQGTDFEPARAWYGIS